MFGVKPVDPFDELLSKARAVLSERGKVLEGIRENELKLAAAENTLGAARTRVQEEEFDAAQREGGLAIASKAASQAVTDAQLSERSLRLRLKGLRDKLAAAEEKLAAARLALDQYEEEFLAGKLAEITAQFDEAIGSVVRLFMKAWVLRDCCGVRFVKKHSYEPILPMLQAHLEHPTRANGPAILNHTLVRTRDGQTGTYEKNWLDDPEASRLNDEIQAVKDRIAEISGAAGEGRQA